MGWPSEFCMGICEERAWTREPEEYPLLKSTTQKCLVKILQVAEDLACSDLQSVEIGDSVIVICSYNL
jgi:hypothetical protein